MILSMKKTIVLFAFLICGNAMFAQDIITMKDGTDIQAKVLEVGQNEISYKKVSNLEGPTYKMGIADILMITYQNGEREMYNTKEKRAPTIPHGIMTYNSWSGKISISGETIPHEMEEMYFYPEDHKSFKIGRSLSTVGCVLSFLGALPLGYNLGDLAAGGDADLSMLVGGGTTMLLGLALAAAGGNRIKTAVANYNASLTFQPEFHVGSTPNGIGLALVF